MDKEEFLIGDNRKKIYQVLEILSSFVVDGFSQFDDTGFESYENSNKERPSTDGGYVIEYFAQNVEDFEEVAKRILIQTNNLQVQIINQLFRELEKKKQAQIEELKQMELDIQNNKLSKQMTFSAPEVLGLAQKFKVRGKTTKNTINKHLNDGTLKGVQQSNGTWVIKREDIEKYLGRDDF